MGVCRCGCGCACVLVRVGVGVGLRARCQLMNMNTKCWITHGSMITMHTRLCFTITHTQMLVGLFQTFLHVCMHALPRGWMHARVWNIVTCMCHGDTKRRRMFTRSTSIGTKASTHTLDREKLRWLVSRENTTKRGIYAIIRVCMPANVPKLFVIWSSHVSMMAYRISRARARVDNGTIRIN
jgi:hypothetical protein